MVVTGEELYSLVSRCVKGGGVIDSDECGTGRSFRICDKSVTVTAKA